MAASFLVRAQVLLPLSSSEDNSLAFLSTLTDRELLIRLYTMKEEGWNHEHTRRPFVGRRFFVFILVFDEKNLKVVGKILSRFLKKQKIREDDTLANPLKVN